MQSDLLQHGILTLHPSYQLTPPLPLSNSLSVLPLLSPSHSSLLLFSFLSFSFYLPLHLKFNLIYVPGCTVCVCFCFCEFVYVCVYARMGAYACVCECVCLHESICPLTAGLCSRVSYSLLTAPRSCIYNLPPNTSC